MPRRKHGQLRGLRAALDARREREADITWRPYVRPFGDQGLSYVSRRGAEGEVIVANAQGITFGPGTIVPVGSHTGHVGEGEVIIGVPPPQKRAGAPAIKTSKTVQAPPAEIVCEVDTASAIPPNFLGYKAAGNVYYLDLYVAGVFDSLYASIPKGVSSTPGAVSWIPSDPFGHVADNSLLLRSNRLEIWDITGAVVHSGLNATASHQYGVPVYVDGWIYMVEFHLFSSDTVRLFRFRTNATADGSTAFSREEVSAHSSISPPSVQPFYFYDDTAYWIRDGSGDFVKMPFDGSTPTTGHTLTSPTPLATPTGYDPFLGVGLTGAQSASSPTRGLYSISGEVATQVYDAPGVIRPATSRTGGAYLWYQGAGAATVYWGNVDDECGVDVGDFAGVTLSPRGDPQWVTKL